MVHAMRVVTSMTKNTAMAHFPGPTAKSTLAAGERASCMVLVCWSIPTGSSPPGSGAMVMSSTPKPGIAGSDELSLARGNLKLRGGLQVPLLCGDIRVEATLGAKCKSFFALSLWGLLLLAAFCLSNRC
mmetsp:Transcript_100565/g.199774  ORF Transcript_100565/g.199774 Transcript_100565/m.199774 type:complete len:129 (+) Transcript_100565:685-1071(+)